MCYSMRCLYQDSEGECTLAFKEKPEDAACQEDYCEEEDDEE